MGNRHHPGLVLLRGLLVVSLALLLANVVWSPRAARREVTRNCSEVAAAAERRSHEVGGHGIRLTVLGDSYAQGYGLAEETDAWPSYVAEQLPARVVVDSFSGSGFTLGASACAGVAFAERANNVLKTRPEIVVIQGGLNDLRSTDTDLRAGVRGVLARLSGVRVIVVGPAAPPNWSDATRVDAFLRGECRRTRVQYVSAQHWALDYLPDGHLTPSGHRAFGEHVAEAIQKGQRGRHP